jgi:hypothetical protein
MQLLWRKATMTARARNPPNQKKLRSTPLARRRLESQLLDLSADPETWTSEHLRRAYEIVAALRPPETTKQIVLDSVRAADRAIKTALGRDLALAHRSALADFTNNCRSIANCTKRTRLRAEIGSELDEAARSTLVRRPVDLGSVQDFFCSSRKVVERRPENKVASAIFKHLIASKGDITHGKDLPLEDMAPKMAVDYEAHPAKVRLACENALQMLVDERPERLTAHEVFASLHATSHSFASAQDLGAEPPIIDCYLAEIDRIWTENNLDLGRGSHPLRKDYCSPFHEFAERVLLDQRDPGSRIFRPSTEADLPDQRDPRSRVFSPFTKAELRSAWAWYNKIPKTAPRGDISATPFGGTWVITEHVLKSYLERSSKKST